MNGMWSCQARPRYLHRLILIACLPGTCLFAQTAELTGMLTDASGSVVPDALVVLTETSTGLQRKSVTGVDGQYRISRLKPAVYQFKVEKAGFRDVILHELSLAVGQIARQDVRLELTDVRGQVTVIASAPLVDQNSATLGGVVRRRQVWTLPLLGRNPYALGLLVPGVRSAAGMNNLVTDVSSTAAVSINGGRNNMNLFLLDGAANNSPLLNQPVTYPSVDSVQEFRVETNSFSAEFGRTVGGVFNVVTKSGSNDLRFTAYEYLRRRALNASDPFAQRVNQTQPFRLDQFGGVVGGPVELPGFCRGRNGTFFFLSTELVRFSQGVTFTGTVPTPEQVGGDFRGLRNAAGQQVVIYDPLTTQRNANGEGFLRLPFYENRIPANRIDPVARNLARFWPSPTQAGAEVNNFIRTDANHIERITYSARLDHQFDSRTWAYSRYSYDDTTNIAASAYGAGNVGSPVRGPQQFTRHGAVAEINRVLTPRLVLVLRPSFSRLTNVRKAHSYPFDLAALGFPANVLTNVGAPPALPSVLISGYSVTGSVPNTTTGLTLGGSEVISNVSNDYGLTTGGTLTSGKHSLKLGAELRRMELNIGTNGGALGFSFSSRFTEGPIAGQPTDTSGSALASFLLGVASPVGNFSAGAANSTPYLALHQNYRAVFIENNWRITPRLTVTAGLRYDYESPRRERYGRLTNFDFTAEPITGSALARGGLSFLGVSTPHSQSDPDRNNFAPRVAIAWSPVSTTVIRTGGGIFYAPTTGIGGTTSGYGISGFQASTPVTTSVDGVNPAIFLSDPFPQGLNQPTGSALGSRTLLGQDISFYDRSNVVPYSGHWKFNVQQQFGSDVLMDVAYAGSRGLKFPVDRQLNQIPPSALVAGSTLLRRVPNPFAGHVLAGPLADAEITVGQLLRPYPHFLQVTSVGAGWSTSAYHSLQARLEKRYSRVTALVSYTWSKLMDDSSGVLVGGEIYSNGAVQNWNDVRFEWAPSVLDQTHRLVLSAVCTLSLRQGAAWVRRFLNGWETALIASAYSGAPLGMTTATDSSNAMGGRQRPNWTGRDAALDHPTPERWFDTTQFSAPGAFRFGNAARTLNGLRSDFGRNVDIGLTRRMAITERVSVEVRAETFNLLNRPQYAPPNTMQGSRTFGTVAGTQNSARVIQFAVKLAR